MLTKPILKIMSKDGQQRMNFYFNKKQNSVYNEVLSTFGDPMLAGTTAKEFQRKKCEKILSVYQKLYARASIDASQAIISTFTGADGKKYDITIYDTTNEVLAKYEQAQARKLTEKEKTIVSEYHKLLLKNIIQNELTSEEKKKVVR